MRTILLVLSVVAFGGRLTADEKAALPPNLQPIAEVEEDVYSYVPADNGARPMWCHGSTCGPVPHTHVASPGPRILSRQMRQNRRLCPRAQTAAVSRPARQYPGS